MTETKRCCKCKEAKPLTAFSKHARAVDGYQDECKVCKKEYQQKHRRSIAGKLAAKKYYSVAKETIAKSGSVWRKKNPIKVAATTLLNNSIRSGKIARGEFCMTCGDSGVKIDAHHNDYAFPLIVSWLCCKCHKEWHRINGEGLNANNLD
jgi:hypothetical protein